MSKTRENLGLLLGFIGVVLFASTVPVTRFAVGALDPWFVTVARAATAGLGGLFALLVFRPTPPARSQWGALAVSTLCLVAGFPALTAVALQTVPAAHGGVMLGILPLATATAAALFAGERPRLGFWVIGTFGAALIVTFALRRGGADAFVAGDGLLIGAVAAAALGYTFSGRLSLHMPGWAVISWVCVIALPVSLPACLWLWPANAAKVPPDLWTAVIFLGLFPQFIGFFAWNKGLALGGIARVSQIQLLQTFVVIALAAVLNGEAIDAETVVFALAVVATVMVGRRMPIAHK